MKSNRTESNCTSILRSARPSPSLNKVHLPFELRSQIRSVLVEGNTMYILSSTIIYRMNLGDPLSAMRISLPSENEGHSTVTNAWLHPNGHSLYIQVNWKSYYILHSSYSHVKPLPRLKGLELKSLGFCNTSDVDSANEFVAVTKEGRIYFASIRIHDPSAHANKRDDKFMKQVYDIQEEATGIAVFEESQVYCFAKSGSIYKWKLNSLRVMDIVQSWQREPTMSQLPKGFVPFHFYRSPSNYYCISEGSGRIVSNHSNMRFSLTGALDWGTHKLDMGNHALIATDYSFLYLTAECKNLVNVGKMMCQPPAIIPLNATVGNEQVLGLAAEYKNATRWLFTSTSIYEITLTNESFSMWFPLYKLGMYEEALKMVSDNKDRDALSIKNAIFMKQGYELLNEGKFGQSVKNESHDERRSRECSLRKGVGLLAKSQEPFEKAVLVLSTVEGKQLSEVSLLRDYLTLKLDHASKVEDKLNMTVLLCYIVHLYSRDMQKTASDKILETSPQVGLRDFTAQDCGDHGSSNPNLLSFLKCNLEMVDQNIIYKLLKRSGLTEILLGLAEPLENYAFIAKHHVELEQWHEAIEAMHKAHIRNSKISNQLILEMSFIMLSKIPEATTKFWLALDDFEYEIVLPAIIQFNELNCTLPYSQNPTLQFLSIVVCERGKGSVLMNTHYLTMLISHTRFCDGSQISEKIIQGLKILRLGQDNSNPSPPYDAEFLLRTCLRFRSIEPAICILVEDLKQYETALALALENRSCRLSELVLLKYDEDGRNLKMSGTKSSESEFHDLVSQGLNKTRFENRNLNLRKVLWLTYARFLVNGVYEDTAPKQSFAVWSIDSDHSTSINTLANQGEFEMVDSIGVRDASDKSRSRLSKIVTRVLNLSKAYGGSAELITFKDILPLLPESVLVNNFRNDIVGFLHHHSTLINHLGSEMQDSAVITSKLKAQIGETNSVVDKGLVCAMIEPGESCCLCRKLLVDKNILLFQSCHHGCHKECAARYLLQSNGNYKFKKAWQIFKRFSNQDNKQALDSFMVSACPLCNEINLNSLEDEPSLEAGRSASADWSISHVTCCRT